MTVLKVLEVSTANVLPETMGHISCGALPISTMSNDNGAFIAVIDFLDPDQPMLKQADLFPLFEAARAADCTWIYLDKDADLLEGVPDYLEFWS
jgi:hypothetical protein